MHTIAAIQNVGEFLLVHQHIHFQAVWIFLAIHIAQILRNPFIENETAYRRNDQFPVILCIEVATNGHQ